MANSKATLVAAQAQTTNQTSPSGLTNGDIVAMTKSFRYTATGDELSIVARNVPYTNGTRADNRQHYARVVLSTDNEQVKELFKNVTDEEFEGDAVFIICEEDHAKVISAIEDDLIDSMILTVGIRLDDRDDDDSDIVPSINFKKAKTLESKVERQKYEAQIKFYSSPKVDAVLSNQLLSELQDKPF